jgi:hypothetical protein
MSEFNYYNAMSPTPSLLAPTLWKELPESPETTLRRRLLSPAVTRRLQEEKTPDPRNQTAALSSAAIERELDRY